MATHSICGMMVMHWAVFAIRPRGAAIESVDGEGPRLVQRSDLFGRLTGAAFLGAVFAVMLQPLRNTFDTDRVPTRTFQWSDFQTTLTSVLGTPNLRAMSFACPMRPIGIFCSQYCITCSMDSGLPDRKSVV